MTREKAIDIFEHNWTRLENHDYTEEELNEALDMAIKALEKLNRFETAYNRVLSAKKVEDVEDLDGNELMIALAGILGCEPRKGYWTYYQNEKGDWINECSVCKRDAGVGYSYNYCPNCGAEMKSEE